MIHGKFILNQVLVESLEEQSQLTQMLRLLSITKPTASSQDYTSTKGTAVDLRNEAKAAVTISDAEDTKYGKTTYILVLQ